MQIAVDVGGTFTDLVVCDEAGNLNGYKSRTTPGDITDGVIDGLRLIARDRGMDLKALLARTRRFGFGTTTATNAVLVGKTARTALITTEGFRDTLLIREGGKDDSYDIHAVYPEPFIPRALTFEVRERVAAEGDVLVPLDGRSVEAAIDACRRAEVEAVAVSLIWSIANPAHEIEIGRRLADSLPKVAVSLGHQVNPCIREYRRTSAAAIDAALKPIISRSIARLEERLAELCFEGTLAYVTSNGGQTSVEQIVRKPVYLCFSGPSAAPEAGRRFAEVESIGAGNVITVDMGGTSFDVSIVSGGRIPMHRDGRIAGHVFGVPSVEIHSIGAGGGSLGWCDSGGFIHAGPDSAGSRPGPACYGSGGTRPTITDANLICGSLGDSFSTAGGMKLSRRLAEAAVRTHLAEPLGMPVEQAAALMRLDCEQKMVVAIEDLTIKRGIDPREYVLVAGGSAAGMHVLAIAREMSIRQVIVPPMSGVLSAFGILTGDISFSFGESRLTRSDEFDFEGVNALLARLGKEARSYLDRMRVDISRQRLMTTCEACYAGQVWQLTVGLDAPHLADPAALAGLVEAFHRLHEAIYMVRSNDPVEFTEWTVQAVGLLDKLEIPDLADAGRDTDPVPVTNRTAFLHEVGGRVEIPVYRGSTLPIERPVTGPAVIEDELTSLLVTPGWRARLTRKGSYLAETV